MTRRTITPHRDRIVFERRHADLGWQVAHIVSDPERAQFITLVFELYASGTYTLERLVAELEHRGLRSRSWRGKPSQPLSLNGLSTVLSNKAYIGIVGWNGTGSSTQGCTRRWSTPRRSGGCKTY